jgi:hypothetical protein
MDISISSDLERLLERKVEAGLYPTREAAVEAALLRFLADDEQDAPKTRDEPAPRDAFDELIDHEFVAYCEREADDSVTLEEVRAATSKIEDSMARVIIEEERADRF